MSRNALFVITFVILGMMAAYLTYGILNIGTIPNDSQKSKMYFAACVLAFLAFIFMLASIIYAFGPEATSSSTENPGKVIFDACVKIIPPMATLIIGFYFGTSQVDQKTEKPPSDHTEEISKK